MVAKQVQIQVEPRHHNARIPTYANPGDAAMDLVAAEMEACPQFTEYDTGLGIAIPKGYVGLLFPRSSVSNTGATMANSVGVIDSGYRGNVKVRFYSDGKSPYKVGDRVAQLMIVKCPNVLVEMVSDLPPSVRGNGNFGSSGK